VRKADKPRTQALLSASSVHELEQVVLFGNVQLTTQAATLLLQHNIDVIFLSQSGSYRGRLQKDGSRLAQLRHKQLLSAGEQRTALRMAIWIVQAKLHHQRLLLQTLEQQVEARVAKTMATAAASIVQLGRGAMAATTLDAARGYEGKGSALYFGALRVLLAPAWGFEGRKYYPPPDPFNALLSFGYALLQKDIESVAQRVGLDPYVGCLHAMEASRPSLVLDLMEEFRPLVVDYAMLDLALGGKIAPQAFTFTGRSDRPVEIGDRLMPRVVEAYEARAEDIVPHNPSGTRQRLRACYELQTRAYARVVAGDQAAFAGVLA
jgi:CRISPR-associated protein Cas1